MEYCETIDDIDFSYAVNTNLTLLTKEIALTFKKYNCKISTSLDGIGEGNDIVRQGLKGEGTFETIVNNIKLLTEINFPLTGFGVTVLKKNFDYINNDIVDFAKEMNIKEITMDFDLVDIMDTPIEESIKKVLSIKKYALDNGIRLHGNWAQPYKNIFINSWLNTPYAYCPAIEGNTIEFGINGNLKTCGHTNTVIGFKDCIDDLFLEKSNYIKLIEERLPGNNMDICKACEIEGACGGQCHVTWEASQSNRKIMDIKCEFTKKMTSALIKEHLEQSS
jgi:radical SAM protein with 4Fe4S-binding SPASM domain